MIVIENNATAQAPPTHQAGGAAGMGVPKPKTTRPMHPGQIAKIINPFENFVAIATLAGMASIFILCQLYWDENLYTPEEGFGYYIGMTGGILMLLAMTYALRKYVPYFRGAGKLKSWMTLHTFLGIFGPMFVMIHSTTNIGSVNGGMALISTVLVVLSGVTGKYIYTKVHLGLYGQKAQLKEIQQYMWLKESNIKARLSLTPQITQWLQDFEKSAAQPSDSIGEAFRKLLSMRFRTRWYYRKLSAEIHKYIITNGKKHNLKNSDIRKRFFYAKRMLRFYLYALRKIVEYSAFERLLRLWRMVHVPLLYLLLTSGIVHVIAVHMY